MKSWKMQVGRAVTKLSEKLIAKLQNKEYRDAYMDEQVRTWIARQIRVLREQRGWSQTEFANVCGKPQSVISRLEDPDYGKISLQTLLDMRGAFDVGLVVRFADYGTALNAHRDLARGAMEVPSFDIDQITPEVEQTGTTIHDIHVLHLSQGDVVEYKSHNRRFDVYDFSSRGNIESDTSSHTSRTFEQKFAR